MNRYPPAARQLITEVNACDPDVVADSGGDPDGFAVHRAIRFTKSDWLADALEAVDDERIASVVKENEASTLVTFVADTRADQTGPFHLDVAHDVLAGDEADAEPEQDQGQDYDEEAEKDDEYGNPRQRRK